VRLTGKAPERVRKGLAEFGVLFLSPVRTWEKTGKRLVYFHGPDGILMELAQYPEEEGNS
jgi:catechol 2,3-dioxygenase-like lactoylglutathione lyase family enzyme